MARVRLPTSSHRAIEIGTAAELIVCADLILAGYRAFLSSAGLPYDLILDTNKRLFRVGVKSTLEAKKRPGREDSRKCYHFSATKIKRDSKGQTSAKPYTSEDIDIMAFIALDIKVIAYVPVVDTLITRCHIDTLEYNIGSNKFGPKHKDEFRKKFEDFSLSKAIKSFGV